MDALYFNKSNIENLVKNDSFNKFFEEWGIDKFFRADEDKIFEWCGKKYTLDRVHTTPCVVMRCIDDDSILSFGVDSEIKDEMVLV